MLNVVYHALIFAIGVFAIVLLGTFLVSIGVPHTDRIVFYIGTFWICWCFAMAVLKLRRRINR
ncbi:hypothetical protein ACTJLD_30335 [Burkholderia sp. 22088]|uniref:hypothetical protein n=1 Tax=Burkholderia sp. 22088 TaxID=3453871 RepID=UPI003F867D45